MENNSQNKSVADSLRRFKLTDDDILNIAIQPTLKGGISVLRTALFNKWDIDTLTAMRIVKELKQELGAN